MIKFLPEIYPDEATYSFLARCYAHSGHIWNSGFVQEIFERPTANIDSCFLNIFRPEFKELLEDKIGFENLALNHTLFKYYARFLPLSKRKNVLQIAVDNNTSISKSLPIPLNTDTSCLRYCPECVREDNLKYCEPYIHIVHTIPNIIVCPKHRCKLINIEFIQDKNRNTSFVPLEQAITDMRTFVYDKDDINVKVAKYTSDIFIEPLNTETELIIGNFLSNELEEKYISPRGEQRNISLLFEDIKEFYAGLHNFSITKNRLAYLYRNLSLNPCDIILVSMFQKISPTKLCLCKGSSEPKHIIFDQRVRYMYQCGISMNKIAQMLNVNHEVIRQILIGTYDKPKQAYSTYKCQKWDWERIDEECCEDFYSKIAVLDKKSISKKAVADLFGLGDSRLRHLPKLNALIREYKRG